MSLKRKSRWLIGFRESDKGVKWWSIGGQLRYCHPCPDAHQFSKLLGCAADFFQVLFSCWMHFACLIRAFEYIYIYIGRLLLCRIPVITPGYIYITSTFIGLHFPLVLVKAIHSRYIVNSYKQWSLRASHSIGLGETLKHVQSIHEWFTFHETVKHGGLKTSRAFFCGMASWQVQR